MTAAFSRRYRSTSNVIFLMLASCLLLASCKKETNNPAVHKPDVYMSGYVDVSAAYWKNGTLVKLSGGQTATGIAVVGNDVFVSGNAGFIYQGGSTTEAVYWKNGVINKLGNAPSYANAIVVDGTDIYVAGNAMINGTYVAAYWKNGTIVPLGNLPYSKANAIAVSNGDVYVVGTAGNNGSLAAYWKNGDLHFLEDSAPSEAFSVLVANNDVYITGSENVTGTSRGAVYWKNGTKVTLNLPDPSTSTVVTTDATGLALAGNDVYVSGYINNYEGVYWKNGIMDHLHNTATYVNITQNQNNILSLDGDVYISFNTADYWKNGEIVHVANGYATSMAVVR